MFREVLLRGIEEHISYGQAFASYQTGEDGVAVTLSNKEVAHGTILIGADGARSAVRKQLSPDHPFIDTGGRIIYGKTHLTSEVAGLLHPSLTQRMAVVKDTQQSSAFSVITEPIVFTNRASVKSNRLQCPEDYLYWAVAAQHSVYGWDEYHVPHLLPDKAEQLAMEVSKDWYSSIRLMIEQQAHGQTSVMPIYSAIPGLGNWTTNPHVILLGDAVHLISPAGAQGAVAALRDAHTLCELLVEGYSDKTV